MAATFVDTRRDLEEVIEEAFDQLATNTYILLKGFIYPCMPLYRYLGH